MGFACRRFLIGDDDVIGRLADATFERMLRDPASHRLPAFAGRRVRMAEVILEGKGRQPIRVVRRTFAMLTVDARGCIDAARFLEQQFARAEVALCPLMLSPATRTSSTPPTALRPMEARGSHLRPSHGPSMTWHWGDGLAVVFRFRARTTYRP